MILRGRAWVMGDAVRATDFVSSRYDQFGLSEQWAECAKHLFEDIEPDFATTVRPGDLILAKQNFGSGHAHYHLTAIQTCRFVGVHGMFAESVNGLFQRAAIDHGAPLWQIKKISDLATTGDHVEIDLARGRAANLESGKTLAFTPVSPIILALLDAGSSREWALRRARQIRP